MTDKKYYSDIISSFMDSENLDIYIITILKYIQYTVNLKNSKVSISDCNMVSKLGIYIRFNTGFVLINKTQTLLKLNHYGTKPPILDNKVLYNYLESNEIVKLDDLISETSELL